MDLATRWSNLFVGMSPASFFNFSFLPKYGVYFLQALGYTLLAYDSLMRGLTKLEANADCLCTDLDANWELLAEPIQTVMRRYGVANPYEKLKELTRGNRVSREGMQEFVKTLDIPEAAKQELLALTPWDYTGKAAELARRI